MLNERDKQPEPQQKQESTTQDVTQLTSLQSKITAKNIKILLQYNMMDKIKT